ncbi:MAG: hypothetical protein DHS20C01_05190 [marine bacterium B5-7]|nr:MAG: hypothetical protein DHS20C01_05190 [marine bacterium B5-7]
MHKATVLLTGILLSAQCAMASAATVIELRGEDSGQPVVNDLEVNGDRIRMVIKDANNPAEVIYFADKDIAYYIDRREKYYTEVSEQSLEQLSSQFKGVIDQVQSQLEQTLEGLSDEQKAQMGDLLANLGLGDKPEQPRPAGSFALTDKVEVINGIRCTRGVMSVDNIPTTQMCIAAPNDLPISQKDYQTIRKLALFASGLASKISSLLPMATASVPTFDVNSFVGLPIDFRDEKMHVSVNAVRQEPLPPITIPDGFTKRTTPIMMQ